MVVVGLLVEKGLARHKKVLGRVVHADDGGLQHGSHDRHGHRGLACKERGIVAGLDELNCLIFCEAGHFAAWGQFVVGNKFEFVSDPLAPAGCMRLPPRARSSTFPTLPFQKHNVKGI